MTDRYVVNLTGSFACSVLALWLAYRSWKRAVL